MSFIAAHSTLVLVMRTTFISMEKGKRCMQQSSLPRFERRDYRAIVLAIIAVVLIIPLSAWVLHPATAHAATPKTWCQSWDPNPANTTDKKLAPFSEKITNEDGSVSEIDQGYYNGVLYYWANLSHATVGDQVALMWWWTQDGNQYQCGDSHGSSRATVWSGSSDTWTAGVPASQVINEDDYNTAYPQVWIN
jgi:hypothetical protein